MTASRKVETWRESASDLVRGRLELTDGEIYIVAGDDGSKIQARRAAGCLLRPEVGDRILVAREAGQESYILSVLVKANSEARLELGGASMTGHEDGLSLTAESIDISAGKQAKIRAPEIGLSGIKGAADFLTFNLNSSRMAAVAKHATMHAERLDSVIGRLTQKMRDSFRQIERLDEVKAGRVRRFIKERFVLRARDATIQADKDIKMDADKIRLG